MARTMVSKLVGSLLLDLKVESSNLSTDGKILHLKTPLISRGYYALYVEFFLNSVTIRMQPGKGCNLRAP